MTHWSALANCKGISPQTMFPGYGGLAGSAAIARAKAVCRGCKVRQECLDEAVATGEKFGVWGGLTEGERRPLRRQYLAERGLRVNANGRPQPAHGTRSRYASGCRCADCRAANASYKRASA